MKRTQGTMQATGKTALAEAILLSCGTDVDKASEPTQPAEELQLLSIGALLLGLSLGAIGRPTARESTTRLPFSEDFSDTTLRDSNLTNANWFTGEQALVLAWRRAQYGVFGSGLAGSNFSTDANFTTSLAQGDVDGDGDLDNV